MESDAIDMNPTTIGLFLGLGAALAWTGANLTIREAADRLGSFGSLLAAQITGVVPILILAALFEGVPKTPPSARIWLLLLLAGLAACFAFGGLFSAFRLGSVSVVGPLISAWSVVSVGIGFVFMGQVPSNWAVIGVVCVGVGNALLARFSMDGSGNTRIMASKRAIGTACLSALGFGVMVPTMNIVAEDVGKLWTIPAVWIIQWLFLFPLLKLIGETLRLPSTKRDWKVAIVPGLFESAGFVSLTFGLGFASMAVVAPTSSLSTGFTVLAGFFFLGERLHPISAMGAGIVAIGVVMVGLT